VKRIIYRINILLLVQNKMVCPIHVYIIDVSIISFVPWQDSTWRPTDASFIHNIQRRRVSHCCRRVRHECVCSAMLAIGEVYQHKGPRLFEIPRDEVKPLNTGHCRWLWHFARHSVCRNKFVVGGLHENVRYSEASVKARFHCKKVFPTVNLSCDRLPVGSNIVVTRCSTKGTTDVKR